MHKIMHKIYNFTELINGLITITKKYGKLSRIVLGTDVFILVSKPEDCKVSFWKDIDTIATLNTFNLNYIKFAACAHKRKWQL